MKKNKRLRIQALALLLMAALLIGGALSACQTAEIHEPESGTATEADEPMRQKAAEIINAAFGTKLSSEDLIVSDESAAFGVYRIITSSDSKNANKRKYYVYFDFETEALTQVGRDYGEQETGHDNLSQEDFSKIKERQNEEKVAEVALEALKAVTGAEPKAYIVDGIQSLNDANDSILTACHILTENGDYYYTDVVFPGYTLGRIFKQGEDLPFPSLEELPNKNFETWGIF